MGNAAVVDGELPGQVSRAEIVSPALAEHALQPPRAKAVVTRRLRRDQQVADLLARVRRAAKTEQTIYRPARSWFVRSAMRPRGNHETVAVAVDRDQPAVAEAQHAQQAGSTVIEKPDRAGLCRRACRPRFDMIGLAAACSDILGTVADAHNAALAIVALRGARRCRQAPCNACQQSPPRPPPTATLRRCVRITHVPASRSTVPHPPFGHART